MGIEVQGKPTSIGTFRYDAFAAGRRTHGFRRTEQEARDAAREDEGMLKEAARASSVATREDEEETPRRRTTRRESVRHEQ